MADLGKWEFSEKGSVARLLADSEVRERSGNPKALPASMLILKKRISERPYDGREKLMNRTFVAVISAVCLSVASGCCTLSCPPVWSPQGPPCCDPAKLAECGCCLSVLQPIFCLLGKICDPSCLYLPCPQCQPGCLCCPSCTALDSKSSVLQCRDGLRPADLSLLPCADPSNVFAETTHSSTLVLRRQSAWTISVWGSRRPEVQAVEPAPPSR